jgi:penicillin amidase
VIKIIKWTGVAIVSLFICLVAITYFVLNASLPEIDGEINSSIIAKEVTLARDEYGTAVINADNEYDAAFALGYAHAQDRLFQIDLLRRQAAGELSELVGARALSVDKKHRIHQFRKRAKNIYTNMSPHYKKLLQSYTEGVNNGAKSLGAKPFEYYLLNGNFTDWQPTDSLLASYAMYIDLQLAQTEIDFRLNALRELYGDSMHQFFTLPSQYQASIDGSVLPIKSVEIPSLPDDFGNQNSTENKTVNTIKNTELIAYDSVLEQPDYGSNNWAVSGDLTQSTNDVKQTKSALVSNDMHLSLRVPSIWYRAQLNYTDNEQSVMVTGVSLPGTPAIVVGSNSKIAWGFTNSNVDNVDWVKLDEDAKTSSINEIIKTPDGDEQFTFEMSEYGPVREFKGQKYGLKWVAHQDYAVNIVIADMAKMSTVTQALDLAATMRMPAQNMVIADAQGNIAWQLTGAITGRTNLKRHAISERDFAQFATLWQQAETKPAKMLNPDNGRVWSANARVVSTVDLARFGDGGYALGARQQQIMQSLMAQNTFTEQDFYELQLDNRALFLMPWHNLLSETLKNSPQKYADDIKALNEWNACACESSVGYTLVRRFRSTVINQLLARLNEDLKKHELSTSYLLRSIEPAIWALLQSESPEWLPKQHTDYTGFLLGAYDTTKEKLLDTYSKQSQSLADLTWGKVNALSVKHPFASQLGPFGDLLNMQEYAGFGDSYTPAVQSGSFGASQRLIVRPGNEQAGILTVPGGQSGHFLSKYYEKGFKEYASHHNTPLLPTGNEHLITFIPASQ